MPIVLFAHDPEWLSQADSIITGLEHLLGKSVIRLEHVGSTAVSGLAAKPKLHIDIVAARAVPLSGLRTQLTAAGYTDLGFLHRPDELQFTRGPSGKFSSATPGEYRQVIAHRISLQHEGQGGAADRYRFRDALRHDRELARRYQGLKARLVREYGDPPDWESYNRAKTTFIESAIGRKPG